MHPVSRRHLLLGASAAALAPRAWAQQGEAMQSWPLRTPNRTGIHDVAPAPGGGVWFTAQRSGHLGHFDPASGATTLIALGERSAPHGVVQGPDGAAWITDSGRNAIVRVGWPDREVRVFALPQGAAYANLNTPAFDGDGQLWFTGQAGYVGRLNAKTAAMLVKPAPGGRGPYGICATPSGEVWWCSLAGSYIAQVDRKTGESTVVTPPTPNQGARRIWSDSQGRLWVSEWMTGQVSMYQPSSKRWRAWKLPGPRPARTYAVYVDERDKVWLSDFGNNAVLRFDPQTESFRSHVFPRESADVRQIAGRPGEVWLPESGTEHISMLRA